MCVILENYYYLFIDIWIIFISRHKYKKRLRGRTLPDYKTSVIYLVSNVTFTAL